MTTSHRTAKEHAELASASLERANLDFAVGNIAVGSKKMWDAAFQAIIAVATHRGWPAETSQDMRNAARWLATECMEPELEAEFLVAEKFLLGFYDPDQFNPFGDNGGLERDQRLVTHFVRRILKMVQEAN